MEISFVEVLQQYGYIGVFLFLVLGIVGLPLPDEIMMTFLGYWTSLGHMDLYLAYFSALAGSISGITISYLIGSRLGYPFLRKHGSKFFITRRRLRITQLMFRKYGNLLLFIAYFIPGVRHVTAYLAGISKLKFSRFALYAYCGAVFWCATFIGLGHAFGESVIHVIHEYGLIVFLIVLPILLIVAFYLWRKNRQTMMKKTSVHPSSRP